MPKDPLCPNLHNDFIGKLVRIKRMSESSPQIQSAIQTCTFSYRRLFSSPHGSPFRREVLVRMSGSRQNQPFIYIMFVRCDQANQETFSSSTLLGRTRWAERSSEDGARRSCSASHLRGGMGTDAPIYPNTHSKSGMTTPSLFLSQHAICIGTGLL